MLPGSDASFGIAAAWLLACIVVWLGVRRWTDPWVRAHPRLTITCAAAVARGVPALTLDRGLFFDISAHWWVGSVVLAGRDVYTAPLTQNRYPYPPLHMYLSAFMVWIAQHDRAAFLAADKLIPAAFGAGIALVVWATARRLGMAPETALTLGLLYAVNPLPVLVTAYHGQLEEIPLLFIALALLLLSGERRTPGVTALSALLLGVAIAYKLWPALFLPPLVLAARGPLRRVLYAPLAFVPLAASIGLYGLAFGSAGMHEAVHRILGYKGASSFCWGYVSVLYPCWEQRTGLRPNTWVFSLNNKLLIAALVLAGVALLWRRRPLEGMVTVPLAFYLFSPGWGPNYSIWVLPFALLLSAPLAIRYTLAMLPVVGLTYVDALYAAYSRNAFSWAVLKPGEAALGLLAWGAIAVLLAQLFTKLSAAGPQPSASWWLPIWEDAREA